MRYLALACDYDGTLAQAGVISHRVVLALKRVVASGRKLILMTGRELDDLLTVCPEVGLFDRVVAENGALLYHPATQHVCVLSEPPPKQFLQWLHEHAVLPLAIGRVIVATHHPHETTVLQGIQELGLELQVIFNKGSVMILPAGVNKASGLTAALRELDLSPHHVVGIGDAENDQAFLSLCECAVAVADAIETLKERADVVTTGGAGLGAIELATMLVTDDLRQFEPRVKRHHIPLGTKQDV